MKALVMVLAVLNGGYMLADGIYVLLKGKYIGPEKPGPWALLFQKLGIDVFKLGPIFIVFGILWLILIYAIWTSQQWAFAYGVAISILTLWYLPFGTLISLVVLGLLLFVRQRIGI